MPKLKPPVNETTSSDQPPSNQVLTVIYGNDVLDDLDFCRQNGSIINRYEHAIRTLSGAPLEVLKHIAEDPMTVSTWKQYLKDHPEDIPVLRNFLERLIRYHVTASKRWAISEST